MSSSFVITSCFSSPNVTAGEDRQMQTNHTRENSFIELLRISMRFFRIALLLVWRLGFRSDQHCASETGRHQKSRVYVPARVRLREAKRVASNHWSFLRV